MTWPAATKATSTARMRKQTPSTASAPVPVAPSLENTSWTEEPEIVVPADFAMRPKSNPEMAIAIPHPMTVARINRMARPVGPKSSRRCGSARGRSATMLAPTSRRPASRTATAAMTR